jgi:hypothetical protein
MKDHELRKKVDELDCELHRVKLMFKAYELCPSTFSQVVVGTYDATEIHKRFEELYKFLGVQRKTLSGTTLEKVKPKQ